MQSCLVQDCKSNHPGGDQLLPDMAWGGTRLPSSGLNHCASKGHFCKDTQTQHGRKDFPSPWCQVSRCRNPSLGKATQLLRCSRASSSDSQGQFSGSLPEAWMVRPWCDLSPEESPYTGLRTSTLALDTLTTIQIFSTLPLSQTPFSGTVSKFSFSATPATCRVLALNHHAWQRGLVCHTWTCQNP